MVHQPEQSSSMVCVICLGPRKTKKPAHPGDKIARGLAIDSSVHYPPPWNDYSYRPWLGPTSRKMLCQCGEAYRVVAKDICYWILELMSRGYIK